MNKTDSDLIFTVLFKRNAASEYIKGVFDELLGKRNEMVTDKEPNIVYKNTKDKNLKIEWNQAKPQRIGKDVSIN